MDSSAGSFKGADLDGNAQIDHRSSECRIGVSLQTSGIPRLTNTAA
jgi:hypothetical protein